MEDAEAEVTTAKSARDSAATNADNAQKAYDTKIAITNSTKKALDDAEKELADLKK